MFTFYIFLFHYFVAGQNNPVTHKHEASRYVLGLLDDLNKGVPKWLTTKGDCTPSGASPPDWDKSCTLTLTEEVPKPDTNHVQSAYIETSLWDKKKKAYYSGIMFDRGVFSKNDLYLQGVIDSNCNTCTSTCTDCVSFELDGKCFLPDPEDFTAKDKQYASPNNCPDHCKAAGRKYPGILEDDDRGVYFCTDAGSAVTTIVDDDSADAWEIQFMYWKTLDFKAAEGRKWKYHPIDCSLPRNSNLPDRYCWTKSGGTPPTKNVQGYSYIVMIRHRKTAKYLTTDGKGGVVLKTATQDDFPLDKDGLSKMNHNSFIWVLQYYSYRYEYKWWEMALIAVEVPVLAGGVVLCVAQPETCGIVTKAVEEAGSVEVEAGVAAGEAAAGTDAAVTSSTAMSQITVRTGTSISSLYDPAASWLVRACTSAAEKSAFARRLKAFINTVQGASVSIWGTKYKIRVFKAFMSLGMYVGAASDIYFNRVAQATRRRLGIDDPQMPQRTPILSIAHLPDDAYQAALWPGSCFERPEMMMSYAECLAGAGGFDSELCGRVGGEVDGLHWVDIGKAGEEYCEIRKRVREGFTIDDYSEPIYPSSIMKMMSSTDTEEHNEGDVDAEGEVGAEASEGDCSCHNDPCDDAFYDSRDGRCWSACWVPESKEPCIMNAAEKRESYAEYALGNNYAIQTFAFLGFCSTIFFIYQLTMKNSAPYQEIVEAEI